MADTLSPPDILSPEHDRDPWTTYRILRDEFPVYYHEGTDSWLISRHADLLAVAKSPDVSNENYVENIGAVHGPTILQFDGQRHTKHRRLLGPFLHAGGVRVFRSTIERVLDDLFARAFERAAAPVARGEAERAEIDLVGDFFHDLPVTVIEEMLDLPRENHADFDRWYKAIMGFIGNLGGDQAAIDAGLQAKREMTEFFPELIAERREGDAEDLLSLMCRAEVDGGRLTDEEVRAFISLMITAGGETTDKAMGQVTANLLAHPDVLEALYADRSLVTAVFAETLRYSPPVHIGGRTPTQELELHGTTIPQGALVTYLIGAANRDPRRFVEPDRFDIHRADNDPDKAFSPAADHLAFFNGRHFCVGAMLAKAEVETGTNLILDHMADLRLAPGSEPVEAGLWTRGYEELRVSFVPR